MVTDLSKEVIWSLSFNWCYNSVYFADASLSNRSPHGSNPNKNIIVNNIKLFIIFRLRYKIINICYFIKSPLVGNQYEAATSLISTFLIS